MRTLRVPPMIDATFPAAVDAALADDQPVVLVGASDTFCRGLTPGPAGIEALHTFARALLRLRAHPAPTIAVLDGDALGGGLGLAAACDFVIARPSVRVGLPEVLFGLSPAIIFPFLRERASAAALRRLALLGGTIPAAEALALGLVDRVEASPDPAPLLRVLARGEPGAVARVKAISPAFEAEVLAACAVTAERIASPAARARRERFAAGLAPWDAGLAPADPALADAAGGAS